TLVLPLRSAASSLSNQACRSPRDFMLTPGLDALAAVRSGSGVGAASRRQTRKGALRRRQLRATLRPVRIEGVRGSNPLSSTKVSGQFRRRGGPLCCPYSCEVQQPWPSGCLPSRRRALSAHYDAEFEVLKIVTDCWGRSRPSCR